MSTIEKIMLKNCIKDMLSNLDVDNVADSTLLTQLYDVLYKINNPVPSLSGKQTIKMIKDNIKGVYDGTL